jgi:hypothetical protein
VADAELETVRDVLNRHRTEIETQYRAVGTAIGKGAGGQPKYVIVVYLKSGNDKPKQPVSIDGVPLDFKVTGPFSLFGSWR